MNDVDLIKSRIDIVEFIGKRVPLKKAGRNFKGLCPFHTEKTPSFMVSPDRQAWHCFGCGKGGSVFDFVMQYYHVEFKEALEDLAEEAGVQLTRRKSGDPREEKIDILLEIHHLAAEYFQFLLLSHSVGENARTYLSKRGVSNAVIKTFGLGYSANSWDGLLKFLKKKGYDEKILEDAGLIISSPRGGYDRFRGRVMFPLRNHRGQILGFSGRLLDSSVKEAKYINSPETLMYKKSEMVFGLDIAKSAIQKEQKVILMEGEFDVLSSFQSGIPNAVAIKGTALTEHQVFLLKRFAKKMVLALDADVAGDKAARRGIEIAEKAGFEIYVASLPEGKDPDEVAQSAPHVLKNCIRDASSIYDYYFSSVLHQCDINTAYGKKQASDELLPIITRIENPIIQAHYIKKLAGLLSVSEQAVIESMKNLQKSQIIPGLGIRQQTSIQKEDTQDIYLLALLLQGNPRLLLSEPRIELEVISSLPVKNIVQMLFESLSNDDFTIDSFLSKLPHEWGRIVDQAMAWDVSEIVSSEDRFQKEWQVVVREYLKKHYKKTIQRLTQELNDDEDGRDEVRQKIADMAKKLSLLEKEK
ncbi:MAG: DNA primase [Patescibacteria group bacterium]|nr:DNA primase [Patescibacteria group bacterium]